MRLPLIIYLFVNVKTISSFQQLLESEPAELKDLFIESLEADPLLLADLEVSDRSKSFINGKIEKFVRLVSQSQNAEFSRTKRSLGEQETSNAMRYSMNIFPRTIVPTEYSEDLRLFEEKNSWFAVSLEDQNKVAVYQYLNGSFFKILQREIKYATNVAVLSLDNLSLVVVGENEHIKILEFNFPKKEFEVLQTIKVTDPKHVVLWEQDHTAYLSITDSLKGHLEKPHSQQSNIKIYQWLGKHFDHIQDIQLFNIKKTVPFNIHGSYFLAAVKHEKHEDEIKSYSEILKFGIDSMKFKTYQRLLTNGCTDIKYFTSELHGENHHFLVVVHSVNNGSSKDISVIYKYEDQYFIPFQSIRTDAVQWQPIQDMTGNAALISVTPSGLKGFQYDGWRFFESHIESDEVRTAVRFEDIKALHAYNFDGQQILVIACDHCKNVTNIYAVNFTDFNAMKDLYSELLSWCTDSLKELEANDESDFVAESLRGDLNEQIPLEEDQNRQLAAALAQSSEILFNIEDALKYSLPSDQGHDFDSNIEAETIIFNNDTIVKSLYTPLINDINIDSLVDNVLNIADGFNVNDSMEFNVVIVEKELNPTKINNIALEQYITLDSAVTLENLTVHGSVTFKNEINVNMSINNVSITANTLLLKAGDQTFAGNLTTGELQADDLTANLLNGLDLNFVNNSSNISQHISQIKHLKVKHLEIGGLLNRVSIPVLARRALKKTGDQTLEEPFSFHSLLVDSFNVGGNLSGYQVPNDFVLTNFGEYIVNQDVTFLKDLQVDKLEVLHSLNDVSVTDDGELDILLTDSPHTQSIPTKKTFENLIITNPIKLRNKLNNADIQRMSPVIIDSDSYEMAGDVTISGQANVTHWLKMDDLKPQDGEISLVDVLDKGVKLSDTQISSHLTFTLPLDLEDIVADRVNSLNPHEWMLEASNSTQVVSGEKTILGNLYLEGHVNAFRINDVDVHALEKEALRIVGDQEVIGIWEVDSMVANKRIISNETYFINSNGSDQNINISDTVVFNGNLKLENLNTTNLEVRGLINDRNVTNVLWNFVRNDTKYKVFGEKKFSQLHVRDLVIEDANSTIINLLRDVLSDQITFDTDLDLFNDIRVQNLKFVKNIANISRENFDSLMNLKSDADDTTFISSDMDYDEVVVLGEVFVADNLINSKNLTSIERDTVKADEDHEFENVIFGEAVFVNKILHLDGNIENLDLDNIVEQSQKEAMDIQNKTFQRSVYINGTLFINNTVSGLDLNKFCKFSIPSEELKTLKVEGDVVFVRGPKILNINNLSISDLKQTLWFSDKAANISGTVHMQNATFNSSVHVLEFVDAINISLLSKNYLSKSKPQVVTASIAFNEVTFSNISAPKLTTKGPVNGILIDSILKTILLQGVPQIFESPGYFDEVNITNLSEDTYYSVNSLDLKTEIMRYDAPNIVTGQKIFNNLNIETLNLTHNVKIQNVDVLDWLGNAILINGTFSVKGKIILKSGIFKQGLSVRGKLNGQDFNEETVLLVNTPQNITGRKYFFSDDRDPTKFKTLRIKGLTNDISIEKLVQNHTNRQQNPTLSSKVVFDNNVVVKNINVNVLYNDVNVSELIANVSKLRNLKTYQNKFNELLEMGLEVDNSLKDQATFFKYYKEVMKLDNVYDVLGVNCQDEIFRLIAFYFENGTSVFRTFEWTPEAETFSFSGENIESLSKPNYIKHLSAAGKDYLYIEHLLDYYGSHQSYRPVYSGRLLQLINSTTFEPVSEFHRNATVSLISFVNPHLNQACLGFIGNTLSGIDIFCDETGQQSYYWSQRIRMEGVYKSATVQTQDSVYLFLARHGPLYKEPSVVVFQSNNESPEFIEIQTIFEGADVNELAAACIGGVPYLAISCGLQETRVESGWISVRKLDRSSNQFLQWQHIPITAPLGLHFVAQTPFEPLLLVPSADASAPLQTFRYDGVAGFKRILKGSSLPISSKVRIIGNGHFVATLQENRNVATILGAVIKGSVRN